MSRKRLSLASSFSLILWLRVSLPSATVVYNQLVSMSSAKSYIELHTYLCQMLKTTITWTFYKCPVKSNKIIPFALQYKGNKVSLR